MSGLIEYPVRFWFVVVPMDMRRSLYSFSTIVQLSFEGIHLVPDRPLFFRTRALRDYERQIHALPKTWRNRKDQDGTFAPQTPQLVVQALRRYQAYRWGKRMR